ncbi:hypothetical protein BAQ47_03285 [Bacillus tropicus]|uniref:hypothetical protein n=1 Tax=Bacillus tropicus TaxID=2026188 RepID=UPI0008FE928A|nr:hypothetical protein [Bacillus tropicus]OJE31685.1 hypothetical protein BAQ47_03285 [Bacillus tropicus]
MAKRKKVRNIDYSKEDIKKLSDLKNDRTFKNYMEHLDTLYDLKIIDFKRDHSSDSDYYFPIEIAELLSMILATLSSHPLRRSNGDTSKIKGSEIAKYINELLDKMDGLDAVFVDMIKTMPAYIESLKIVNLMDKVIEEFTILTSSLTYFDNQRTGETIQELYNALKKVNRNIYQSNNMLEQVLTSNEEYMRTNYPEQFEDEDIKKSSLDNNLMRNNISLDKAIAYLIKRLLLDTEDLYISDKGQPAFHFQEDDVNLFPFLGLKLVNVTEEDDEESLRNSVILERVLYLNTLYNYIDKSRLDEAQWLEDKFTNYLAREQHSEDVEEKDYLEYRKNLLNNNRKLKEKNDVLIGQLLLGLYR